MESILTSIKKMLGIAEDYTHFDQDLIIHINTTLSVLNQLGVGPATGFTVDSNLTTWRSLIGDDTQLELIKSYVYLKVKMIFDPPQSTALIEATERQIKELEYRIVTISDLRTV